MGKAKDAVKRELKEQYEIGCYGYVTELLRMWDLDAYYGYWIGGEAGGTYDYGGAFTISMEDIIFCVEHDVTESQYQEWLSYVCDASEFGFDTPNLKAWMRGCPRTDEATFERLRGLKADLAKAVKDEKDRVKDETRERDRIVGDE